jgi:hypothetical protein
MGKDWRITTVRTGLRADSGALRSGEGDRLCF